VGCYTAYICGCLPTFRDGLSITSSGVKQNPEERIPYVIYWTELCIFQIHLILKKCILNMMNMNFLGMMNSSIVNDMRMIVTRDFGML
jgi:hypothetical protein